MRTFLSLAPDAHTAIAIEKWCSLCWPALSRKVPMQNYHVTVAFLGDINNDQLILLREMLDQLEHSAFELVFNEVKYWPDSTLLWLGADTVPDDALQLADKCKNIANRAGVRTGSRRYEPHLTLARKTESPPGVPLIDPQFPMKFESVQLMQSIRERSGVRYIELDSWPMK